MESTRSRLPEVERHDGGSTRSLATDEATGKWTSSPWWPRIIKASMFILPLLVAMVVGWVYARVFSAPVGIAAAVPWWIGLMAVTSAAIYGMRPLIQRIAPLAFLFQLTLVFPDTAPSRYRMALRQRSARDLQRQLASGQALGSTPQEAAENVVTLVTLLNDHDRRTRGHCERVRAYSDLIAQDLKLSKDEREKLHWAALLHDIGKLSVPPDILNKDGHPNDLEWNILRQHPSSAGHLLVPLVGWLGEWILAATQHHERWDGDGYPRGLARDQISLSGRIVAVADAFDVMTSPRSYKPAWSAEDARRELARNAGTQFDPRVVRAFLSVRTSQLHRVAGPLSWLTESPRSAEVLARATTSSGSTVGAIGSVLTSAAIAASSVFTFAPDRSAPAPEIASEQPSGAAAAADDVTETTTVVIDNTNDADAPETGSTEPTIAIPVGSGASTTSTSPTTSTTVASQSTTTTIGQASSTTSSPSTTAPPPTTTTTSPDPAPTVPATTSTTTPATTAAPTTTEGPQPPPGGYQVVSRDDLLGAVGSGGLAADLWVHLAAESDPVMLDEGLLVLAPAETVTASSTATTLIESGTRVCTSIIHAQRATGAGVISFEINFVGTLLGFAVTDGQLDDTGDFLSADEPYVFAGIEGPDWVGHANGVVTGTFHGDASNGDVDEIRLFIGC